MSEHLSHQEPFKEIEPLVPSDEELKRGFFLGAHEKVKFAISPNSARARRNYSMGNGVEINGQALAELRFGGQETYATGIVINIFATDEPELQRDVLVVYSPDTERTFTAELTPGKMLGIGREFDDQNMLPDTVSRDHCAVGKNEAGEFVIENHNPTNQTGARRIG